MFLSDFDYEYPEELIAQRPLQERDASRMMVVDRRARVWRHSRVSELSSALQPGDLLVVNDSRVAPARIFGRRCTGEELEVLVVEPYDGSAAGGQRTESRDPRLPNRGSRNLWRCLLKKAKRIRAGEQFYFGMQSTATAHGRDGIFLILEFKGDALELAMKHHGAPPLPPYIEREGLKAYTDEDRERYQTVYAKSSGSAAAPTAGLHLSDALLAEITSRGIGVARVTLHVGIDTFAPVRVDDLSTHRMHGERYEIGDESADAINRAKREGRRIVAVGTTTTRALESAALKCRDPESGDRAADEIVRAGEATTELFITPGFEFRAVDAMLTNFHQPRSTLIMMVSAFACPPSLMREGDKPMQGRDFIVDLYREAIRERYRLFSFGDCMLIG